MNVQGAKVKVGATQVVTNFNNATGQWEAIIPPQGPPAYVITVEQEDLSSRFIVMTLDILNLAGGQALKLSALEGATALGLVRMQIFHQTGGLADFGLADDRLTESVSGSVIAFIGNGNYNVVITAQGFQPVRLKTVQVPNGTADVDAGGAQLASHTLLNSDGTPANGAKIFIQDSSVAVPEDSLAAKRTTDGAGLWAANLAPATPYRFCMHKPGFDSVVAEVESIG